MNKENVTSIEQSLRLEELIGTETADMMYIGANEDYLRIKDKNTLVGRLDVPAWSFGALCDLIPIDQLETWVLMSNTMFDGFSCMENSPVGRNSYKGKTKLEAVYNAVIDIYERRKNDD